MLRSIQYAILLTTLAIPTPVLAWGAVGHEVICEIAFQELIPPAREKVKALIECEPACNFDPLTGVIGIQF